MPLSYEAHNYKLTYHRNCKVSKLKIIYHKHLLVETWFTVVAAAGVRLRYGEGREGWRQGRGGLTGN